MGLVSEWTWKEAGQGLGLVEEERSILQGKLFQVSVPGRGESCFWRFK